MGIVLINDENFNDEVLESKLPIIIDFYASWCAPCGMMSKIFHELGEQFEGKPIKLVKINIDQAPRVSATFQVRSVPTIILFRDGQVLDAQSGIVQLNALTDIANQLIEESKLN